MALLIVALLGAPASAAAPPTSKVSGAIRATWVHERGSVASGGEGFRREVAIRWTPVSVSRSVRQAFSWLSEPASRYGDYALDFDWGYVLRATVQVERFTETLRQQCRDGSFAELTTTIASLSGSRVLLKTSDTRLDVPRRRGTLDVRLPNEHVATGEALPNAFLASGLARLTYTGTICPASGDSPAPPGPGENLPDERPLGDFLGSEPLNGVVQDNGDLPVTISRDGTLTVSAKRTHDFAGVDEGVRISGTYAADLKLTGPLGDRTARCALPTTAEMRSAASLAAARRLLRSHGFPAAPLGRPRTPRAGERGGRFALNAPAGASAGCGSTLGTAKRPVLVPLTR